MNQFFYEIRGKEKVKGLMEEGMRSQTFRRSGVTKSSLAHNLPKIVLILIGILGVAELLLN
jgi:hypothetical protein